MTVECLKSFYGHSVNFRFSSSCVSKMACRRAKVQFGPRGRVFSVHRVLLTLKRLRSFWGHSVHFQAFISKIVGFRVKFGPGKGRVVSVHRILLTLVSA